MNDTENMTDEEKLQRLLAVYILQDSELEAPECLHHNESNRYFPQIFERNYQEYLVSRPDATPHDFLEDLKPYLANLLKKVDAHFKEVPRERLSLERMWFLQLGARFYHEYLINGLGLDSVLTEKELESMYDKMKPYCSSSKQHFVAALTHRPLVPGFERVRWIDLNRNNRSNQYSLRAFFEVVTGGKIIKKADVSRCFAQPDGQPIILGKPKKDEFYKRYIIKFSNMI